MLANVPDLHVGDHVEFSIQERNVIIRRHLLLTTFSTKFFCVVFVSSKSFKIYICNIVFF